MNETALVSLLVCDLLLKLSLLSDVNAQVLLRSDVGVMLESLNYNAMVILWTALLTEQFA